jgi:hypothetical protein
MGRDRPGARRGLDEVRARPPETGDAALAFLPGLDELEPTLDRSWRGWTTVASSSPSEIVLLAEDGRELVRVQT